MNIKKFNRLLSLLLVVVLAFSCGAVAFAASPTVTKQPKTTSFYQGIDWVYVKGTNKITLTGDDLNLDGIVISSNGKSYSYGPSAFIKGAPNMFTKPETGKWASGDNNAVAGDNNIRVYGDDFSGYATLKVKFVALKSISVITPPNRTYLLQDIDWKLGLFGDVEYTNYNINGMSVKATYTDGTTKTISYPENKLLSFTAPEGVDSVYPGNVTFYALFCDKTAPVELTFASKLPNKLGDISKDGSINSYDALMALQQSTGIIKLGSLERTLADVNSDHNINSSDALAILKYSVGLIKKF